MPERDLNRLPTTVVPSHYDLELAPDLDAATFTGREEVTLVVTEPSGRKFTGDQVYGDEFIVSLRDRDGWIHSWKRASVNVDVHDPLAVHEALLTKYTDKNIHDLFAYLETLK